METEKKSVPAAAYVACGVAVGAVLGLLFAPKKGSELRADIDEFGRAASRKTRKLYAQAKGLIPDTAKAAELVGVAKTAGRHALHDVRDKMHAALRS